MQKKTLLFILVAVHIFLLANKVLSQGFAFKLFTTEDGILSKYITGVKQDGKGRLWIKHGNGFTSYDGRQFIVHIDPKTDQLWSWDYNNFATTKDGNVFYSSGLGFNILGIKGKTELSAADSVLVYHNSKFGGVKRIENLIDKDGYRIFTSYKSKLSLDFNDTIYYQYMDSIKYTLLPKKLSRNVSKINTSAGVNRQTDIRILYKDNIDNVYIRICDTIDLKNSFYLFRKGELINVAESSNLSSALRIVRTKEDYIWLIGMVNTNLIAECYNSNFKLLKVIIENNFFQKKSLHTCSQMLPDSKGNVWFSWPNGLVKINLYGITLIEDKNRTIQKKTQSIFDQNNVEFFSTIDDYSRYINGFAIDQFDNIISGDRLFDGVSFSPLCIDRGFEALFRGDKPAFIHQIFCDRENNLWIALDIGLVQLTQMPFKKIETRFSSEEPDFRLYIKDDSGNSYFLKKDLKNHTLYIRITKENKIVKQHAIHNQDDNQQILINKFSGGVIVRYWDKALHPCIAFLYEDNIKFLSESAGSFRQLFVSDDVFLLYLDLPFHLKKTSNTLAMVTKQGIHKLKLPDSIAAIANDVKYNSTFRHAMVNWPYIIGNDFNAYKINDDYSFERVTLPQIPKDKKLKYGDFKFYLERTTRTTYYIDKYGTFLKIKDNKVDRYEVINWDSLQLNNEISRVFQESERYGSANSFIRMHNLYMFGMIDAIIVFEEIENGILKFKQIIKFEEQKRLQSFLASDYFSDGDFLVMKGEFDLKVITYEDILNKDLNNFKTYKTEVEINSTFQRLRDSLLIFGPYVSYLGRRGFNTVEPILSDLELTYHDGKTRINKGYKSESEITIPYLDSRLYFEFSAICLTDGSKVKYKLKLEGYDSEWEITDQRSREYTSLSPGTYTFFIHASNNEAIWTKDPLWVKLMVLPPWYLTWWAYLFYLIGLTALVWGIIRFRLRKLQLEKEKLEYKVQVRTKEVILQKQIIEEKQTEILDSINYAQRIQRSMLASESMLKQYLKEYFVLFKPKDIVSGDFYWSSVLNNGNFALVTADSTGHGVPGAIMSMLNIACLNEATESQNLLNPSDILNYTRKSVIRHLSNDGSKEGGRDGMDCSIIVFTPDKERMYYSGANNPVWIIRNNELIELEPDKMPVGRHEKDCNNFTQIEVDLFPNDLIYTLTDGYPDQFGGLKGKKYMYKRLKEKLLSIAEMDIKEQERLLRIELENWMADLEQVDDITVLGIRI